MSSRARERHERAGGEFPNLTIVDVGAAVRQAQGVIDQLVSAVQFVFLFALGAGLLVLYSALRRHGGRAPARGGGDARVRRIARARHARAAHGIPGHGAIAGILATLGAAAIGQLLARRVFEIDLPPDPALWIAGPLAGLALLSLNAWLSSRKVLRTSPALTLRDSV